MTGKEALEKLLDTLKHWQGRNTIFDKIHSKHILDELELLDKYKRAFEILKEKFKIQLSNDVIESVDMNDNPKTYYIYQVMFVYDRAIYAHDLEQEEHELLEELMKGE